MNYTNPNDVDHEDILQDWLLSSLIFSRTLGFLLPEGKGIVIDLQGDMIELIPNVKRVIVHHIGKQISVIVANERTDLKEGDFVNIINGGDIQN